MWQVTGNGEKTMIVVYNVTILQGVIALCSGRTGPYFPAHDELGALDVGSQG